MFQYRQVLVRLRHAIPIATLRGRG